jgi:uncharacterized protein
LTVQQLELLVLNDTPSRKSRNVRLGCEFAGLYLLMPLLLWWLGRGREVLPVLWLASVLALLVLLAQAGSAARLASLLRWQGWSDVWRPMLGRTLFAAVTLTVLLWLWRPEWLFAFPRQRPRIWLMVIVLYPLLSVLPQGIVYRALFYARYAGLWRRPVSARLATTLSFSLAHLVFNNAGALVLTFIGGWIFAGLYERTQSLPISCLEHAIYGNLLFTIGWGPLLYHGTQALVA